MTTLTLADIGIAAVGGVAACGISLILAEIWWHAVQKRRLVKAVKLVDDAKAGLQEKIQELEIEQLRDDSEENPQ